MDATQYGMRLNVVAKELGQSAHYVHRCCVRASRWIKNQGETGVDCPTHIEGKIEILQLVMQ